MSGKTNIWSVLGVFTFLMAAQSCDKQKAMERRLRAVEKEAQEAQSMCEYRFDLEHAHTPAEWDAAIAGKKKRDEKIWGPAK